MPRYSDIPYNPIQTVTPGFQTPGGLSVQATPEKMGAAIGESLQKTGATLEQTGQNASNLAVQQQGMLNETYANDGSVGFGKDVGELKNQFTQLRGLDAVNAKDAYMQKVLDTREQWLSKMPNNAARNALSQLTNRTATYELESIGSHAAQQQVAANTASLGARMNLDMESLSDPNVAGNEFEVSRRLTNIKLDAASMVQNQMGLTSEMTVDPKTGDINFGTGKEGQDAKAMYQTYINKVLDKSYKNIFDTKAYDAQTGNIVNAVNWLQGNKDKMPASTFAELSAKAAAPYRSFQAHTSADWALSQALGNYHKQIGEGTLSALTGNLTTDDVKNLENSGQTAVSSAGAVGTYQVMPATAKAYGFDPSKLTDPAYSQKVSQAVLDDASKRFPNDPVAQAIAYNAGPKRAEEFVKSGRDISVLPKETQGYVERLYGLRGTAPWAPNQKLNWVSETDYLRSHESDIVEAAGSHYLSEHSGDIQGYDSTKAMAQQRINTAISQQKGHIKVLKDNLFKYIHDNNISDVYQLTGPQTSPDIRNQFDELMKDDYFGGMTIQNLIRSNNRGKATTLGTNYWDLYSKVMTGQIKSDDQLNPYLSFTGKNPNEAPLTNTGFWQIKQMMEDRKDPANAAFQDQEYKFFKTLHDQFTGAKLNNGQPIQGLESNFTRAVQTLLPLINAERASGKSAGDLFDPKSTDYIGNKVKPPKSADITKALMDSTMFHLGQNTTTTTSQQNPNNITMENIKSQDDFIKFYASGGFGDPKNPATRIKAQAFALEHNLAKQAPEVPFANQ